MSGWNYYLGPWVWDATGPLPCWRAPAGTVGNVDLASLTDLASPTGSARKCGFFATSAVLPSEYALLGSGDLRDLNSIAALQAAWKAQTGYKPQGDKLIDLLWDHLTNGSDPDGSSACLPLVPGVDGWMDLYLGGHSRVRGERFEWGRPGSRGTDHTPKMRQLLRLQFAQLFADAHAGRLKDAQQHLRVLDFWCEKYGVADWKEFVPPALVAQVPGRVKHETTITETFNQADSSAIGPNLSWTKVMGAWSTISNQLSYDTFDASNDARVRANSDLSSSDHYSQNDIVVAGTNGTFGHGACARYAGAADTCYQAWNFTDGNVYCSKVVGGTRTNLTNVVQALSPPATVKMECNGSTLKVYWNGSVIITMTDTAIAGNTRGGVFAYHSNSGITPKFDNFQAADLAASGIVYTQLERSVRGLNRGMYFYNGG